MPSLIPTTSSTGRPEPVLDAAKLAAAVSGTVLAVGAGLVLIGWVTADQVQNWAVIAGGIVTAVGTLLAVAMPLITALGARAQVTPLAAPVSVQGTPLVPAGPAAPTPAAPSPTPPSPAATQVEIPPVEFTDQLRALELADAQAAEAGPHPWADTTPVAALGSWTPATPTTVEAEPTPIGTEAQAAASAASTSSLTH